MKSLTKLKRNIVNNLSSYEKANKTIWNLSVEITYNCNARCCFCQRWKDKTTMDERVLRRVLEQADGLAEIVVISGGEPLLYPNLIEILEEFNERSYDINICTNGILLPKMADKVSKVADRVFVSLDSHIPEVHNEIRGVSNGWEKAVKGIEMLKSLNFPVNIQSVITDTNIEHIDELYKFSFELGCDYFAQAVHNEKTTKLALEKEMNFSEEQITKKCSELAKQAKKYVQTSWMQEVYYNLAKYFLIEPEKLNWMKCTVAGKDLLFISPSGYIYPCETRRDFNLGNIEKINLKSILKNEVPKFRKRLKNQTCVCLRGCTADNMIKYQFKPFGDYAYGIPAKYLWKRRLRKMKNK